MDLSQHGIWSLHSTIETELAKVRAVDVHTHMPNPNAGGKLIAGQLSDVLLYHYIRTELICAGMPRRMFGGDRPDNDVVVSAKPFIQWIRNTASYSCLQRILTDIYGLEDVDAVWSDPNPLRAKIQQNLSNWRNHEKTVRDRSSVGLSFITCDFWDDPLDPALNQPGTVKTVRFDSIWTGIIPEGSPESGAPHDHNRSPVRSWQKLAEISGRELVCLADLEEVVEQRVDSHHREGAVALTASVSPEEPFGSIQRNTAEEIFRRVLAGDVISAQQIRGFSSYWLSKMFEWAREYGLTVQLLIGVRRPMPGGTELAGFNSEMGPRLSRVLNSYPETRFDVFLGTPVLSHDVVVLAKNYPNLWLSSNWWYALTPSLVRHVLRERLELLPMNKIIGFFSDAYCLEWSYGKMFMVRKEIARVLAEMVLEGLIHEDVAIEIGRALLNLNPVRAYGIGATQTEL